MSRAFLVVVVAVVSTFAGLSGCKTGGGETLVVRKLLVDVEPAAEQAGLKDREVIRGLVQKALDERSVRIDEKRDDGAVLRVRVESYSKPPPPPKGSEPETIPQSSVSLSVEVSGGKGTSAPTARGRSTMNAPADVDVNAILAQALKDALSQVLQAREADGLTSDALLSWLPLDAQVSEDQRRQAIRLLGNRREKRAVEPLGKLLQGADRDRAMLSLGALASIGDDSAVDAIIEFSERKPAQVRRSCVDAVRAIGSHKAAAWLFVLSSGHPDADIQALATQALGGLETSTDEKGRVAEQRPDTPPTTQTP